VATVLVGTRDRLGSRAADADVRGGAVGAVLLVALSAADLPTAAGVLTLCDRVNAWAADQLAVLAGAVRPDTGPGVPV
jgi:hypothetical protein